MRKKKKNIKKDVKIEKEVIEEVADEIEEPEEAVEETAEETVEETAEETAEETIEEIELVEEPVGEIEAQGEVIGEIEAEAETEAEMAVDDDKTDLIEEDEEVVEEKTEQVEEPERIQEEPEEAPQEEPAPQPEEVKAAAKPASATPGITVVFYIAGIVFLIVSLFMLFTAISYTRTYLSSYEAAFADMWSNSVQYVIGQFVPYLAFGVISIGIGKAIKEFKAGRQAVQMPVDDIVEELRGLQVESEPAEAQPAIDTSVTDALVAEQQRAANQTSSLALQVERTSRNINEMAQEIEMLREIMSIKFEETEKRQTYRLEDNRKILADDLVALKDSSAQKDEELMAQLRKVVAYIEDEQEDVEDVNDTVSAYIEKRERHFIK